MATKGTMRVILYNNINANYNHDMLITMIDVC